MAIIVAILGDSGDGKTTSTVINPDGKFNPQDYKGMSPKSHYIMNLDGKPLPFPRGMWESQLGNYSEPTSFKEIKDELIKISKNSNIKSVAIDTINVYLAFKEFNDRRKMDFDKWRDVANDVLELNRICADTLRDDQIVYIMGHTMVQEQPSGEDRRVFSVIGKKLRKTPPEAFYSIVLITRPDYGDGGSNTFYFQTRAYHSSAKTPLGMFKDFEIPNSLRLVDDTIRKYYQIS